jgi:transcriptional regulator with XRE-family HTH domain
MTNRIRVVRESKGWNQRELAEAAHVCQTTISELERGVRKPWPRVKKKLARVLKTTPEELFPDAQTQDR